MSPRKPEPEPDRPAVERRSAIPERVAEALRRRAQAFAVATSRPRGKPWDGATYGTEKEPTPKQRADRAKAIRDAEDAARRRDAQE